MDIFLWLADKFGFLAKLRFRLQGMKTYLVNIIQALGGIVALLALIGQVLDLVAKTLQISLGWSDGQATGDSLTAVKALWANHAILAAGFSAALYAITDAFSKMAAYAANQRRAQVQLEATKAAADFPKQIIVGNAADPGAGTIEINTIGKPEVKP